MNAPVPIPTASATILGTIKGCSDRCLVSVRLLHSRDLVFPDRATFLAWMAQLSAPGIGEQVAADEAKFLDRSWTRAYVVEENVTSG